MNVCAAACESLVIKVLEEYLKIPEFENDLYLYFNVIKQNVTVKDNNGKKHVAI